MSAKLSDHSTVLAVSDGRPGNARQAEALAGALAPGRASAIHLAPRAPWRWASPRCLPGSRRAFGAEFAGILNAPPALAIGCGRQAALATRLLRAAGSRVVQVLNPRLAREHWDVLVVPAHDGLTGDNVIAVNGSLNPVDDAWLAAARMVFSRFERFPAPRLGVLVGGDSRHGALPAASGDTLIDLITRWHRATGGSVLATTSRRTPAALAERLAAHLGGIPGLCWTGHGNGANPYSGLLAFADTLVCSADSVNLLSEACATRVPVAVIGADALGDRRAAFVRGLLSSGRIRVADSVDALVTPASTDITPMRETARIAALVRARLGWADAA